MLTLYRRKGKASRLLVQILFIFWATYVLSLPKKGLKTVIKCFKICSAKIRHLWLCVYGGCMYVLLSAWTPYVSWIFRERTIQLWYKKTHFFGYVFKISNTSNNLIFFWYIETIHFHLLFYFFINSSKRVNIFEFYEISLKGFREFQLLVIGWPTESHLLFTTASATDISQLVIRWPKVGTRLTESVSFDRLLRRRWSACQNFSPCSSFYTR